MSYKKAMDKAELRKTLAARRDAMPLALRQAKAQAIWERLAALEAFQQAEQALFYVSLRSEVDSTQMRRASRALGKDVAVPRAEPGSRKMRFHLLPAGEALDSGAYGLLQPQASAPLADLGRPSIVLVPGLGFDRHGHRLGFGGGYYDRWLADEGRGLVTVGLAFDEQWVEGLPVQPHDIALQWVVTDKEALDCRKR